MKIDPSLNFVIPIYAEDGLAVRCYCHSTPIAREVFERFFLVIAQTFAAIFNKGLGVAGGPAIASLLLKQCADASGERQIVEEGLLAEIRRLTIVVAPGPQGWRGVPLDTAVENMGLITADDRAEVENAIVFFIVVSAMLKRAERREMLSRAADLWGAQISSLDSTAFIASLQTSTGTANSGETVAPATVQTPGGPANAVVDGKPLSVPR